METRTCGPDFRTGIRQTVAMTTVSVVIPCYRSAQTLPALVGRLLTVLSATAHAFEVILVVDGSPDNTWEVAQDLVHRHDAVRALLLARNYGQQNALIAGIRCSRHEIVVTMDDDLQHPPEEIPKLLAGLRPDLDIVYGVRSAGTHGLMRDIASKSLKTILAGRFGTENSQYISAFRAFRGFLRESLEKLDAPSTQIDIAFSWTTTRIGAAQVNLRSRVSGRSNYSLSMLIRHAIAVLIGYSTLPLRLVTYFGLLTGAFGLVLLFLFLWTYWAGDSTVQGFTSTASMIALFAAAQMIALGIIGQYLGRVHAERMGRPTYVVRNICEPAGFPKAAAPGAATAALSR